MGLRTSRGRRLRITKMEKARECFLGQRTLYQTFTNGMQTFASQIDDSSSEITCGSPSHNFIFVSGLETNAEDLVRSADLLWSKVHSEEELLDCWIRRYGSAVGNSPKRREDGGTSHKHLTRLHTWLWRFDISSLICNTLRSKDYWQSSQDAKRKQPLIHNLLNSHTPSMSRMERQTQPRVVCLAYVRRK